MPPILASVTVISIHGRISPHSFPPPPHPPLLPSHPLSFSPLPRDSPPRPRWASARGVIYYDQREREASYEIRTTDITGETYIYIYLCYFFHIYIFFTFFTFSSFFISSFLFFFILLPPCSSSAILQPLHFLFFPNLTPVPNPPFPSLIPHLLLLSLSLLTL